jgi:uncharacterized membrane protein YkvA (DUF1232 family)
MGFRERWWRQAAALKREVYALYLACRDPRVPWYAKALAAAVVAYGLSPIDVIPDFIPVLGYLDDLVLIPLGVLLVRALIPRPVMEDCRRRAALALAEDKPTSRAGVVIVVTIWISLAVLGIWMAFWLVEVAE